jgi:hypothetical protein
VCNNSEACVIAGEARNKSECVPASDITCMLQTAHLIYTRARYIKEDGWLLNLYSPVTYIGLLLFAYIKRNIASKRKLEMNMRKSKN